MWHFPKHFVIFSPTTRLPCVILFCSQLLPVHSLIKIVDHESVLGRMWHRGCCLRKAVSVNSMWLWDKVSLTPKYILNFHFKHVVLQFNQACGFHFSVTCTQVSWVVLISMIWVRCQPCLLPQYFSDCYPTALHPVFSFSVRLCGWN